MNTKYKKIIIPKDLNELVINSIDEGKKTRRYFYFLKSSLVFSLMLLMVINTNPVLAKNASNLPFIGNIFKLITFVEYQEIDNTKIVNVKIPQIENDGNDTWLNEINEIIISTIDSEVIDSREIAEEYFEAYVETGGNAEDFIPVSINVEYSLKYSNEEYLSFVINKDESLGSAYNHNYYYNIDLLTKTELSLKDLFGENYVSLITQQVNNQIIDRDLKNEIFDFVEISDYVNLDSHFYINKVNEVVLVFEKYEIMPGCNGTTEFIINR
jgi:hypothetical protein